MDNLEIEDLAMIAILLDEDEAAKKKVVKKRKRTWVHDMWKKRNIEGEFTTLYNELVDHETKFFEYFRMSKYSFDILLLKIQDDIKRQDTHWRLAITPMERLAVTLRFLATGDSFKTISFSYRLGHSTVYQIVIDTCRAIVHRLMPEVMPPPTEDRWEQIAQDFWMLWNFPNCLGAIDGKHVTIQAPPNSGSNYYNYKKTFSIVLLALVDAHNNFIAVDVGSYGKNSDGGILAHSNLGKALENNSLKIPESKTLPGTNTKAPFVIVGDEAFPLKTYLLRPYPGKQLDCFDKKIYNYRLCRPRRVVENTFGILSQKFRLYNRRIQSKPENADFIILATCVLHNFIRRDCRATSFLQHNDPPTISSELQNIPMQGGSARQAAFEVRELYKDFFNSPAGSVPWQNEKVSK